MTTALVMPDPIDRLVRVYHGTDRAAAHKILNTQAFEPSQGEAEWFGHGVYFFEDSPTHAWRWARRKFDRSAAVIQASVFLGRCIDLTEKYFLDEVNKIAAELLVERATNLEALKNDGHSRRLDCAVMNKVFASTTPPADTARALVTTGEPIYPGAAILDNNHIQLCVMNLRNIMIPFKVLDQES